MICVLQINILNMVQDYIRSRKALKWAVLARQIGWDRSSFHQWMTGIRKIPAEKLEKLESILINEYGMSKNAPGTKPHPFSTPPALTHINFPTVNLSDVDPDLAEKLEKHFEILKEQK